MTKYYLTTAIPYVNAAPHLGHALEFMQADAIARYRRSRGDDVYFLTGADENAQKNVQAAEARNIDVHELVDQNTKKFTDVLKEINISHDDFIRTADKKRHWPGARKLWDLCDERGDIYKKSYTGLYCVGCEAFLQEKDLEHGLCPEHQKAPEQVEEENYFFKLSRYQERLQQLIESDELLIVPETKKNEVLSFIASGLDDFSISRSATRMKGWGIPVPGDDTQIIYVWFDALINYLTGLGFGTKNEKLFDEYWPCDMHVIGKGITRFHAIYWPAMLLSAGIALPKSVFVHGYVTLSGGKMSKSLGTIIDPLDMVKSYGTDALRYYVLGHLPTFDDGDFSEEQLIEAINNELVATLGNLVNRTFVFIKNYLDGTIAKSPQTSAADEQFWNAIKEKEAKVTNLLERVKLRDALKAVMDVARDGNAYFQANQPWKAVKEDPKRAATALYYLAHLCRDLAILLEPYLPNTSESIFSQLGVQPQSWDALGTLDLGGKAIGEPQHLFAKVEDKTIKALQERFSGKAEEQPVTPCVASGFDLRVARIINVEQHPDADKLYIETLDVGPLGPRTIVSGLKGYYDPADLLGMQIVLVANLKPAKLRGVLSEGMLLAAEDDNDHVGLVLAPDASPGDQVIISNLQSSPKESVDIKEFFSVQIDATTDGASLGGKPLLVNGKPLIIDKGVIGKVR